MVKIDTYRFGVCFGSPQKTVKFIIGNIVAKISLENYFVLLLKVYKGNMGYYTNIKILFTCVMYVFI